MIEVDIDIIIEITKEAGFAAMAHYEDPQTSLKKDMSPVTKADTAAEKVLLGRLKEIGDYGVLSEETFDDRSRLDKKNVWIIDPLDGTSDFIQKTGEFSVMVGLSSDGQPIAGIVYLPATDKLYYAEKNKGSFLVDADGNKRKLQVATTSCVDDARLVVSRNHLSKDDDIFAKSLKPKEYIKAGSNGVKMGLIAEGAADLFFNSWGGFGEWDSCAPQIVLTEAGGKVTGTDGNPLIYNKNVAKCEKGIVASNNLLHDKIIEKFTK